MKEREVSAYLSMIGFAQVLFVAIGSFIVSNIEENMAETERLFALGSFEAICIIVMVYWYALIFRSRKRKK